LNACRSRNARAVKLGACPQLTLSAVDPLITTPGGMCVISQR